MATVVPLAANPQRKTYFCNLYAHIVLMPQLESKSDSKLLTYWGEGYGGAAGRFHKESII